MDSTTSHEATRKGAYGKTYAGSLAVASFAMALAVSSGAAQYSWVNGSTDWGSCSSYRDASGNVPQSLPGNGDVLKFSGGASATVSSDDSSALERLNAISYVDFNNATITFDCAQDVTLNCGFYAASDDVKATVVKRGSGALVLAAKGKAPKYSNMYGDAHVDFVIESGPFRFYQGSDLDVDMRVRNVTVGQNAVCYLPIRKKTQIMNLRGDGLVTNDYALASGVVLSMYGPAGSFSGEIHGKFDVYLEAGRTDLWGENNSWSGSTILQNNAAIGLKRIGSTAEAGSVGKSELSTRGGSGKIIYLGDGEMSRRSFTAWNRPSVPITFDAGAYGGLTMLGVFDIQQWDWYGMYHLCLTGSNRTECVLLGNISQCSKNGTNYNFYVTKDGTGTWYLKDPTNRVGRTWGGVLDVKKGTLKFDSVAEKGAATSLGTAGELSSQKTGFPRDSSKNVDYAYVLGSGDAQGSLEFVGKNNCRTTTRPAVLNGVGAIVNNSTNSELRLRGVSAMGAGAKTLVLGGTNTMENVVWDVTDGAGSVSVEKRGSGTWVLGGTNSFSGSLAVKEGTLVVRNDKGAPYTWFKLVIMQIAAVHPNLGPGSAQSGDATNMIDIVEWGLYDTDGKRVNKNTNVDDGYNRPFRTLRPMQIAIGRDSQPSVNGTYPGSYRGPNALVDSGYSAMQITANNKAPSLGNPDTWVPVVMRLSNDAGIVQSYDLFYGDSMQGNYRGRYPTAFALEGSVDGYAWEEIARTNDLTNAGFGWLSKTSGGPDRTSGGGIQIRGVGTNDCHSLSAVETVSVASGATLKASGEVWLSCLTVDCAAGAGTIDGFNLSASGELRASNVPKEGCDLPFKFENVQGVSNLAAWKVVADGKEDVMSLSVGSDGKVRLRGKGLTVILR